MTNENITPLTTYALAVLKTASAHDKAYKTRDFATQWRRRQEADKVIGIAEDVPARPARPEKPELLFPRDMPKRKKGNHDHNKINLLHALSHIELNAIDLAWDIIARFSYLYRSDVQARDAVTNTNINDGENFSLPLAFYEDWLKVADDEAKHFLMLSTELEKFGKAYGDLPAHDGLWESAEKTANDFAARLAIVPMVLEARGLDVTPNMIELMKAQGDDDMAATLQIIYNDEVTHVQAGTVWFKKYCTHYNKNEELYFQELVQNYFHATLKRPFNHPAREEAGMIRD